jgi:agmatinase
MSLTIPPRRTPGTFLYSNPVTSLDDLKADIAFLGVPYAQAYSWEDITNDQSNGPTAMREATSRIIRSIERYDFDLGGPLYADKPIRAVDCGDIASRRCAKSSRPGRCRSSWAAIMACRFRCCARSKAKVRSR